jgi:hypothetical protein
MTLRPGETSGRGIAVLPFLKTTEPVRLGSLTFRSTDDLAGLDEEDAAHIREVADMLFLQDDLRIRSASYALLPMVDLDKPESPVLRELQSIQAIVGYCYSAPHPTLGKPFFAFEQASLAIFSPEPVPIFLVRPDHHVVGAPDSVPLKEDEWHRVAGYQGRYNFRHPFWMAKGSRLYPPVPHIGLNISQDLACDLGRAFTEAPHHHLLPQLIAQASETSERVLIAIDWYNRANSGSDDDAAAIIHLAVAFETLLGLPKDAKTDRFVDAVSLLLGRVARLNLWAEQFYDARSDVAHEGTTDRLHFIPVKQKGPAEGPRYQPLLIYGRQIFQLCVGALLFGSYLADRVGLRDKLITNQERFELICKTLGNDALTPVERFAAIDDTVALIDQFRFVGDEGLSLDAMIGALQRAAKTFLLCGDLGDPMLKQHVEALALATRTADSYDALAAVQALHDLKTVPLGDPRSPQWILRRLAEIAWHYIFRHYFWLRDQKAKAGS